MKNSDLQYHLKSLVAVRAPVLVSVILLVIGILIQVPDGSSEFAAHVYRAFGLHWQYFKNGWIWQVFTYAFLHGGGLHLALNVTGIILLGSRIELILGTAGFLKTCLLGILAGGVAHLIMAAGGPGASILVGFSAAVMAMILVLTTLSPESRMWPLPVSGRSLGLGILLAEGILAVIDPSLGLPMLSEVGIWITRHGGAQWFDIAHACHFGGGLAGWLYGRWLLRQRVSIESLRRARRRREGD